MVRVSAILFVAAALFSAGLAYCQDENNETMVFQDHGNTERVLKTFDGTVSKLNVMGQKITVDGANSVTFSVPINAVIKKDIFDIKLSDVNAGDYVTIEYYDLPSGDRTVESITVEYGPGE